MTNFLNRWLPGVTLAAWGAILLTFSFSGRIAAFLHPTFRPGVLIAGFLMLALGIAFAFSPGAESCCDEENCGHPLGRMTFGRLLTFLILLLPIGTAAMFSPQNFGASTIANRGVITDAAALTGRVAQTPRTTSVEPPLPTKDGSQAAPEQAAAANDYLPKGENGSVKVAVIDLLYAAQDPSLRADFENKKVELIGQLMPDNVSNASGKRFKLVRMFMVCCAADARPVAALIESDQKTNAAEMSWIKVIGTATFPIESGRPIAIVRAESVVETTPPDETMLY